MFRLQTASAEIKLKLYRVFLKVHKNKEKFNENLIQLIDNATLSLNLKELEKYVEIVSVRDPLMTFEIYSENNKFLSEMLRIISYSTHQDAVNGNLRNMFGVDNKMKTPLE